MHTLIFLLRKDICGLVRWLKVGDPSLDAMGKKWVPASLNSVPPSQLPPQNNLEAGGLVRWYIG